jgi:uncharacterized protein (TIGR00661 family)
MRILYAIQGTGNGHLSRARDIIPILKKNHDVDILVSGSQADVTLPYEVKYMFHGLSFIFGAKGGVDLLETYKKSNIKVLLSEINSLPVNEYDLILNDFEPVSAWACYLNNKACITLSHQSAVLHKKAPQPKDIDPLGKAILQNYAPATEKYGFHFKSYGNQIFTPVIRKQVREQIIEDRGHYTVYLPSYDDERILKVLRMFEDTKWQVFSKHNKQGFTENNISIQPINNEAFIESMATSTGVLCGAGFETPAEALFMNKKLMVIPMKGQYEQQCNAAALKEMGVPVIKSLKLKQVDKIRQWIEDETKIEVNYPDETESIVNNILSKYTPTHIDEISQERNKPSTAKKLQRMLLKSIAKEL